MQSHNRLFQSKEHDDLQTDFADTTGANEISKKTKLEQLQEILTQPCSSPRTRVSSSPTEVLHEIRKEMNVFETTGERPAKLQKLYRALITLPASSVEAERTFSAALLFLTEIRSLLADNSIDKLVSLRKYFQNKRQ